MLVFAALFGGIAFAILGTATLRPLLVALGASGQMLEDGIVYGSILVMSVPFTILQYLFQELMMTAGKPDMAFGVTMAGEAAGALIPLVYFMRKNTSNLRLVRTRFDWRTLGRACWNGSSEMVSNIASSVVAMVYNIQLLAYLGEPGVAAYGVIMYAGFLFAAVFLGYCTGCAPLMSYHLGARNGEEMASLFRKSLLIVGVAGVGMFALTRVLVTPLATLFVGYDAGLLELTAVLVRAAGDGLQRVRLVAVHRRGKRPRQRADFVRAHVHLRNRRRAAGAAGAWRRRHLAVHPGSRSRSPGADRHHDVLPETVPPRRRAEETQVAQRTGPLRPNDRKRRMALLRNHVRFSPSATSKLFAKTS